MLFIQYNDHLKKKEKKKKKKKGKVAKEKKKKKKGKVARRGEGTYDDADKSKCDVDPRADDGNEHRPAPHGLHRQLHQLTALPVFYKS